MQFLYTNMPPAVYNNVIGRRGVQISACRCGAMYRLRALRKGVPGDKSGVAAETAGGVRRKNKDENVRMKSSSGGIFTLLAESVIQAGGVVFGARFDSEWNVVHDYTESVEGLEAFRGSKYVQSDIGNNFKKAEAFLHVGRKVLFSGTPCQIAGLKKFLRRDYDALLTVEVVCHGVPSPMVWRDYLEYKRAKRAAGKIRFHHL